MRETLEQVYHDHRQGLYTLALSITGRADLAEDGIQEAFVRLWRTGRRPEGDLVAYVFAAVRNAAIDVKRKAGRQADQAVSVFNGRPAAEDGESIDAETEGIVRDAIGALPEAQRETLILKIYAELTFEQIAAVTGDRLNTVTSRYRRGLERLGKRLEKLR